MLFSVVTMKTSLILHLTNTYIPSDPRIIKELQTISKLPDVVVSYIDSCLSTNRLQNNSIQIDHYFTVFPFVRFLSFLPRSIFYILLLIELNSRFLTRIFSLNPTIVHCHDTFVLPSAVIAKFFMRYKIIYDAHELESNKNCQSSILSFATFFIEFFSWPSVDHFISVSKSIVEWYLSHFSLKPYTLIYNYPLVCSDSHRFPSNIRSTFGIPPHSPLFCYVGIFSKGRCIEDLLSAFSNFPEFNIVFIGDGALKHLVDYYSSLCQNIHVMATVPHDELVSLLSDVDYGFCLLKKSSLSDYLSLPNKLFEYISSGLYVIASDFPEISKLLSSTGFGDVILPTSQALTEYLAQLDPDKNPIPRVGYDLLDFSWQSQEPTLLSLYRSLIHC